MRLLAIVVVILGMVAGEAAAEPRIAVIGDDAAVTAAVRVALDKKVQVVPVDRDSRDVIALAVEHSLEAVVVVVVSGTAKKAKATISVKQGASGEQLASFTVKGKRKKLAKDAGKQAWKKLGKAIGKARAPGIPVAAAPNEPDGPAEIPIVAQPERPVIDSPASSGAAATNEPTGVAATATPTAPARRAAPWLVVAVDGRPFLRTLRYKDDIDEQLRTYDLAAPAAGVTAQWRPRAHGAARFFAVRAELELALGVDGSRTDDGTEYGTSSSEWSAGVRAELPLAGWQWTIDAAYGEHRFAIADDAAMAEVMPDVTYRWLRGGLGVTAPINDKLAVSGGAGWRQLLDTGDLESAAWFPRSSGAGLDVEAGVTWRAFGAVEVFGRADLRRYFFSMNPEPGDALVVGGAVDQYLALVAGVSVSLR